MPGPRLVRPRPFPAHTAAFSDQWSRLRTSITAVVLTALTISTALAVTPSAGAASAAPAEAPWTPMATDPAREGLRTWVRRTDDSPVKAFRGETELHQPVPNVLALLADIPNLSTWVYQIDTAQRPAGFTPDHTYARFRGIWPASDRDVLMRSSVSQLADGTQVVASKQVAGYPEQSGFVRIPYLRNTFRLVPLPDGWTRIEFDTQVDPGGLVPAWLVNLISTKAPVVTLRGLRAQLSGSTRYHVHALDELPVYYLQGAMLQFAPSHWKPSPP
jgi:hypothetical protein